MEIAYLNTNGFYGDKNKMCFSDKNNQYNAEMILQKIFILCFPDVLFFSEFNANSHVGKFVINFLKEKKYYPVYPNGFTEIDERYTSIVLAFVKVEKKSETSPNNWLKWNEILIDEYRIVGVHIPDCQHCLKYAINFWECFDSHYQNYISNRVIYIGDMNVFKEGTFGKNKLNKILETAKDGWLDTGHSNDKELDFTYKDKSRIDYAILSYQMPKILEMHNYQEFFNEKISDHSLLQIKF